MPPNSVSRIFCQWSVPFTSSTRATLGAAGEELKQCHVAVPLLTLQRARRQHDESCTAIYRSPTTLHPPANYRPTETIHSLFVYHTKPHLPQK